MKLQNIVFAMALLSSSLTFAATRLSSMEDLRNACKDPARYQNQIAPSNIQVSCTDVQYSWVPNGNGQVNFEARRVVTTALASDKYSIASTTTDASRTTQAAACPKFKQISETVSVSKGLTCEEALAFTGTLTEYCVALVNDTRAANAGAITTADTGLTSDICSATAPTSNRNNNSGRGQR